MQAVVNVNRTDLIRFNVSTLFQIRANWVLFLMFWAGTIFLYWSRGLLTPPITNVLAQLAGTILIAALGFGAMFLFMMIFMLFSVGSKSGITGERTVLIEDGGIRELTEANDSLHYWASIRSVRTAGNITMVQLNQYQFLLLPKHGFESPENFDVFCEEVEERWRSAN